MSIELKAERIDSAHETPITFRITKPLLFTADESSVDFLAKVWCPDADIMHNAAKLGEFSERVRSGSIDDGLRVMFGLTQIDFPLKVHPAKCTLEFFSKSSKRVIVSVSLTSLPPGMPMPPDLLDTCTVNFETTEDFIEEFAKELGQSSSSPWRACLRGFEIID